jgi:hypothetical protein
MTTIDNKHSFLSTIDDITQWLDSMDIKNYSINSDLTVDVDGMVAISLKNLTFIPVQFGVVKGDFYCSHNRLVSLKGSPKIVDNFTCNDNRLTSLEFSPEIVGDSMDCFNNQITSLKGMPLKIQGYFDAKNNHIQTLEGLSHQIGGNIRLNHNRLTSLFGAPEKVDGSFDISDNLLINLEFAPKIIKKGFNANNNKLLSLMGGHQYVGNSYSVGNNTLTNLTGVAKYIGQTLNINTSPIQIKHALDVELDFFVHYCEHEKDKIEIFNHLYDKSGKRLGIKKEEFELVMNQLKALNEKEKLEQVMMNPSTIMNQLDEKRNKMKL